MWPINLPAEHVLALSDSGNTPRWAVFDANWYRSAHPDLAAMDDDALMAHYLREGQKQGHSPNRWFDEAWYRRTYPGVRLSIETGNHASGFDHYCRTGNSTRSPHWLFEEQQYRQRYPDLSDEVLARDQTANGYDHFLRHGDKEGRVAHPLFDAATYLASCDPTEQESIRQSGPFKHLLTHLETTRKEARTSLYLDPVWYLDHYPDVAMAIAGDAWRSALHHYLGNDTPTEFDPIPEFSEHWYLSRHPEVAGEVKAGNLRNGYQHFLRHGAAENRSPREGFDARWYASQDVVHDALTRRRFPHGFAHYLAKGSRMGLPVHPPPPQPAEPAVPVTASRAPTPALLPLFGRQKLAFDCDGEPDISVVVCIRDDFANLITTLRSLRDNHAGPMDLILLDCGSSDECRYIDRYVSGAQRIRFDTDVSRQAARNAGLQYAHGSVVLFLSPDIRIEHGAIDTALRRLKADASIAAVCGMVLAPGGMVAEAGCILWRDGSFSRYGDAWAPDAPGVNFVRDVDFATADFLMVQRTWMTRTGGFDDLLQTSEYACGDLCARITDAGGRIRFDPAVITHRLQERPIDAPGRDADQAAFRDKHGGALASRPSRSDTAVPVARNADREPRRVLFIEELLPLRSLGSGFVRANDLIRAMVSLGFQVTVYPLESNRFSLAAVYADMPDRVEVMHDHAIEELSDFLHTRPNHYDIILISRTHNLDRTIDAVARAISASTRKPTLVLDTEAIATLREHERRKIVGKPFDTDMAVTRELANAIRCDRIVAVTEIEAGVLRKTGFDNVNVIGHVRTLTPTSRPFAQRVGMLFVGAIHEAGSPNHDSLEWFCDAVLPLVEQELGWMTRLTVVGHVAPDVPLDRFRNHPRLTLRGELQSLTSLYDSHRLFVAPTRFAAGTPYNTSRPNP